MKIAVEDIIEVLTQIHINQVVEYQLAISMGTLFERQPPPDLEGKTGELETLYRPLLIALLKGKVTTNT